jgi:uncharacterized membrane protein
VVEGYDVVRLLHLLALAFFVGGQLVLVAALVPVTRRAGADEVMRAVARRFGVGSVVAIAVLVATGAEMAQRGDRWGDATLHAKLGLLVVVGVLLALHVVAPGRRALSVAVFVLSLAISALGVALAH